MYPRVPRSRCRAPEPGSYTWMGSRIKALNGRKEVDMSEQLVPTKSEIFVQGAFLRLQMGFAAAGIVALCMPDIIVRNHKNLVTGTLIYSIICLAGGLKDANTTSIQEKKMFGRITLRHFVQTSISLAVFAYLIIKMR